MKKFFTFAAALLASLSMMAGELFSFTVTSETTATGSYADGAAVLSGSAMATGGTNEVTVGEQTFYKFNSSTTWTFTVDDEVAVRYVITLTVASNATNKKSGKGVIINGVTMTAATIEAGASAEITYTVVADDGIAGTNVLVMKRADSDIKFGTIVITGDHTPINKYTVTYMDGETVLGTETVKEGEKATKASTYEAKAHATFVGWFEDAALTVPANFNAAITADKTFYGKWTANAFTASTSLNIEQLVLDNGKGYDIAGALTAAHIEYANINALDSLNDEKTYRNEPFLGLKLKTTGAYVEVGLDAGDVLRVKFGNVGADVKINGVTVAKADLANPYQYTATEQEYIRIETTSSSTVVLKQIMINQEIANVVLPEPIATSINNLEAAKAIKVIENGQIVIIKNGVRYNAVGAKL